MALYTASNATGTLVIGMVSQTITFDPLPNRAAQRRLVQSQCNASSGLTVTYTSLTTGKCTVSNKKLTLVATGTCTIRASQAGNSNDYPAPTSIGASTSRIRQRTSSSSK